MEISETDEGTNLNLHDQVALLFLMVLSMNGVTAFEERTGILESRIVFTSRDFIFFTVELSK